MIREELSSAIARAIGALVRDGRLPASEAGAPEIQDTKSPEHGDYACNWALVAAKSVGKPPREVAELLRSALESEPILESVEVAGPGFLNLRVRPSAIAGYVPQVLAAGEGFGSSRASRPQKINVEFVSVNPNGPITVGSGRGAAFGSTLCHVLEAAGHEVHREYYINDGVNSEQMRLFAESIEYYLAKPFRPSKPFPDGGYKGDYVEERAADLLSAIEQWQEAQDRRVEVGPTIEWTSPQSTSPSPLVRTVKGNASVSLSTSHVAALSDWVKGLSLPSQEGSAPMASIRSTVEALMVASQKRDLAAFGVEFDTWFSEQSLHTAGLVDRCLADLIERGAADDLPHRTQLQLARGGKVEQAVREPQDASPDEGEEGAGEGDQPTLWLRSTKFGDDMDRVLRRRDGRLTYIASDVAYHQDKFNRPKNADKLITILGPDHHGYIGRLTAVVAALLMRPASGGGELEGWEAEVFRSAAERDACREALAEARRRLEVVIFQIVRFVKEGKPAPMRKRDGNIYALIDLVREIGRNVAPDAPQEEQERIGRDVSRFFYLMRSHETHMDFDIDLATKQSDENPVFYTQYAHARICSVLRKAAEAGLRADPGACAELVHPRESTLIKKILDLPFEVSRCAEDYGVHRLTTYAVELARTYHHFYDACRVIQQENPKLSGARLALCEATRVALRSVFRLLGVSAPERMERGE